jgi:hypothetical protein
MNFYKIKLKLKKIIILYKMSQTTGLNRNIIDKFYTKNEIALRYYNIFKKYININENDNIIEPSAGNGSFFKLLENDSEINNFKGYDILPDYKNIIKCDFLKLELNNKEKYHFIGNPPFGRQSSLAKKFIKKCCEYGESISFILPKSFKKESFKNSFNEYFHLIFEEDLDKNSFIINETDEKNIPCVFQIWRKKNIKRIKVKKENPKNFIYVKKNEEPDFSLRRVGGKAGEICNENINIKAITTHYFIKILNNKNKMDFYNNFKKINFNHNNTVGPKSISKNEFNIEINKIL